MGAYPAQLYRNLRDLTQATTTGCHTQILTNPGMDTGEGDVYWSPLGISITGSVGLFQDVLIAWDTEEYLPLRSRANILLLSNNIYYVCIWIIHNTH